MKFLGNVLAVIVGLFIFSILSVLVTFGMIAMIAASGEKEVTIKENSILHLNLNGRSLVERTSENEMDLSFLGNPFGREFKAGLVNLKKAIGEAKTNDDIKGIYLNTGLIMARQANLLELREVLEDFKTSGKFIVAYDEAYTEGGYYLASVADELYLNPMGAIDFNGFSSEVIFLKGFFEKVGIKPEVFRVGEFKSAVEPFILDKMSPENRLQTQSFLDDINKNALKGIAKSKGMNLDSLTKINVQMLVRKPEDAVKYGLATALAYEDEIEGKLKAKLGIGEDDKISSINASELNSTVKSKNVTSKNRIAVIIAEGDIVSGKADGAISSDKFAEEIRKARKDENIKAIILRVNSPGGSILASEVIWREMVLAKKEKPVVVSIGDVAASGGYYISCAADRIFASPVSITGSIGVFGVLFNGQRFLEQKLGITVDTVKTNTHADLGSVYRPLTSEERMVVQQSVEDVYTTFITRVGKGRNMRISQVDSVGQGRVWAGYDAGKIQLVDEFGGLNEAVAYAARLAKINESDMRVQELPSEKPLFEKFISELSGEEEARILEERLGPAYKYYLQAKHLIQVKGVQARVPYEIEIN